MPREAKRTLSPEEKLKYASLEGLIESWYRSRHTHDGFGLILHGGTHRHVPTDGIDGVIQELRLESLNSDVKRKGKKK